LNNARIYYAEQRISFINKDFLLLDKSKDFEDLIDVVFISPPWGGITYSKELIYNLDQIVPNFRDTLRKALLLANNVVLFLPRNTDLKQLETIISSYDSVYSSSNECFVSIEVLIKSNTNISALVVYIGPLFKVCKVYYE
jgi:trimethylguanosine synthase